MPRRLPSLRLTNAQKPGDTGNIDVGMPDVGAKLMLYNESPYNIDLDFNDGNTDVLHAWEGNYWVLGGDVKQVGWTIDQDNLNQQNAPIYVVFVTVYNADESVLGQYPTALNRLTSIGNPLGVNTTVVATTAQELVNTGQPDGTATFNVSNSKGTQWSGDTTGAMTIAAIYDGVLVPVLKILTVNGQPLLELVSSGYNAEVLGNLIIDQLVHALANLQVDGNATITGNTTITGNETVSGNRNVVGSDTIGGTLTVTGDAAFHGALTAVNVTHDELVSGAILCGSFFEPTKTTSWASISGSGGAMNTRIQSGNVINLQVPPGSGIASIDATGLTVGGGTGIHLPSGQKLFFESGADSLRQAHSFSGNGSGTYNHGCAATPYIVAPIPHQNGSTTTFSYDSENASTVHITQFSALPFVALCMVG